MGTRFGLGTGVYISPGPRDVSANVMATEDNVPVPSAEEVAGVGAGGGGEEQGRERENRPHEVIKVKVTGYQLSAKDFSYQLEVYGRRESGCLLYICSVHHR